MVQQPVIDPASLLCIALGDAVSASERRRYIATTAADRADDERDAPAPGPEFVRRREASAGR